MARILVRHRVKDFSAWKKVYTAHAPARTAAGFTHSRVSQAADDPNHVVIQFECKDLAAAQRFTQSQDLKEAMQRAGVIEAPDIYFLTDGETFSS